jgi:uncharacterized Zn finger protein
LVEPLDGNAIAGMLLAYFGTEMTTAGGSCAHCGAAARIAELQVFGRAPGAVARCRSCGSVVIVVIERGSDVRVALSGFQLREAPAG